MQSYLLLWVGLFVCFSSFKIGLTLSFPAECKLERKEILHNTRSASLFQSGGGAEERCELIAAELCAAQVRCCWETVVR